MFTKDNAKQLGALGGFTKRLNSKDTLPHDMGTIRRLRKIDVTRILDYLSLLPSNKVRELGLDEDQPHLVRTLANFFYFTSIKADPTRLNLILERLIGKVEDVIRVESDDHMFQDMSPLEIALKRKAIEKELDVLRQRSADSGTGVEAIEVKSIGEESSDEEQPT